MTTHRTIALVALHEDSPPLHAGRYVHALAYAHVADLELVGELRRIGLKGDGDLTNEHPTRRYVIAEVDTAWRAVDETDGASRDEAEAFLRATLLDDAAEKMTLPKARGATCG